MYIVKITNGTLETTIHGQRDKLQSGKISKGINTIDSFTFSMLPNNPGFNLINEFTTLVTVYNTNKQRYDFHGRVLYAETTMDENGLITKTVTCENIFGYLCDSWQTYVDTQNWTVSGLLQHLIDCHNSQVEDYKQFKLGTVTATDKNDNLYQAVQRENTWDAIKNKLIDKIGGELQVRVEDDGIYIDYLEQIGEKSDTKIALSVNMKSITREQDPTAFITRLIPLGAKTSDDSEERLDISSVNDGLTYIDDEEAIAVYGVHVGVVEWDDVTTAAALKTKGEAWLEENNKVQVKYSITALDLSLLGLVLDDFDVGNIHPVKNSSIAVDDTARIIKKSVDICEETKSTIEVGDNLKTLSDIQREQAAQIKSATDSVKELGKTTSDLEKVNTRLGNAETDIDDLQERLGNTETAVGEIEEQLGSVKLEVSGSLGSKAKIKLSLGEDEYTGEIDLTGIRKAFANDNSAVSITSGTVTFNNTLVVLGADGNQYKVSVDETGTLIATAI